MAKAVGRDGEDEVVEIARGEGLKAELASQEEDTRGTDVWVKGKCPIQVKKWQMSTGIRFDAGKGWTWIMYLQAGISIAFLWPNGGYALVPWGAKVRASEAAFEWMQKQHLNRGSHADIRSAFGVFACTGAAHLGTKLRHLPPPPPRVDVAIPSPAVKRARRGDSDGEALESLPMLGPRKREKKGNECEGK